MALASKQKPAQSSLDFLSGGGEMGALMRSHDWSSSSLGCPTRWPQALRTSVRLLLNTGHPMYIWWGADGACLYNDAYRESIGPERHPGSLGRPAREVWEEIWPIISPQIEQVMSGRGATWNVNHLVPITRYGRREDVYWTYSYSPIDDETVSAGIGGVLVVCTETTQQILAARHLAGERDRLAQLFQQAPTFMALLRGPEHRFEIANPAYMQLIDHRPVLGRTVAEALPDAVAQGYLALLDQVFRSGQAYVASGAKLMIEPTPGGPVDERYLNFVYQPIVDSNGNVDGIFVEGTDVTDQVRSKQEVERVNRELAEAVRRLERVERRQSFQLELADTLRSLDSPEEIIISACTLMGRRLDVSRVVYGEVNADGEHVFMRYDWTSAGVQSIAGVTNRVSDFGLQTIAALRAGEVIVNHDVSRNSRTASYVQAYNQIGVGAELLIPLIKSGVLRLVLAFHRSGPCDWTEEEIEFGQEMAERTWAAVEAACAQAELHVERNHTESVLDSMGEGFALFSSDWTVLRVNAGGLRLIQREKSDVIGRNHWDTFPEFRNTEIETLYHRVLASGVPGTIEHTYFLPDGKMIWVEVRAYPVLNEWLAVFFRDITDRKESEIKLKEADRRKDEFLAMLGHELRNPLAPISAAAELLQVVRLEEGPMRQTTEIICRQVAHMTSLIDDLLDVSRVTRGLIRLENAEVDVRQIVTEAVEQATPLIQARRHHLQLHLAPDTSLVIGDKKRLVQVVANLINNSAKFTPEGGEIIVKTEVHETEVVFEVVDNGVGMTADLTERVFELFAQAERTADRSLGGLGLGLALVRSLVELHGGSVSCISEGLGKGSRFIVTLPRLLAKDIQTSQQNGESAVSKAARPLRILIVDDNSDAATMLKLLLEAAGHKVMVEHGARAALERACNESPDVCLLDIGLPEMNGYELARQLRERQLRDNPKAAIAVLIAVTGYGQQSDREQVRAAGFDFHLVKPVDTKKLSSLLVQAANFLPALR